jgi:hypothetical protein
VSTAPDSHEKLSLSCEIDGFDDVGNAGALDDQRRFLIDHSIPDGSGIVVAIVIELKYLTTHTGPEAFDRILVDV